MSIPIVRQFLCRLARRTWNRIWKKKLIIPLMCWNVTKRYCCCWWRCSNDFCYNRKFGFMFCGCPFSTYYEYFWSFHASRVPAIEMTIRHITDGNLLDGGYGSFLLVYRPPFWTPPVFTMYTVYVYTVSANRSDCSIIYKEQWHDILANMSNNNSALRVHMRVGLENMEPVNGQCLCAIER